MREFMKRHDNDTLNLVAMFASGGIVGAGLALLLAPQSGKETRQSLTHMGSAIQKRSRRLRSDLHKRMDHLLTDIQDDVKSCMNNGKTWTEEKSREIEQALTRGKRHMEKEIGKILHA
jgi:gas vesicle protein